MDVTVNVPGGVPTRSTGCVLKRFSADSGNPKGRQYSMSQLGPLFMRE